MFYLRRASGMLRWLPTEPGADRMLGTEHIMLGFLSNGSHAAGKLLLAFDGEGFDRTVTKFDSGAGGAASNPRRAALRKALMEIVNEGRGDASATEPALTERGQLSPSSPASGADGRPIDRFAPDLTALAKEGRLDPFTGREALLSRVERALGRRMKRNVLLVGDPGVGKTAVVEALAQRIAAGRAPTWLAGKRLRSLDVALLTAGTRLRGDFEERLRFLLEDVDQEGSVLFIDEAHTLIGAGATGSSPQNAADILKPVLARGQLQCIAATTMEEYFQYFSRDAALERRFELVEVEEPTAQETVVVLEGLRNHYERYHGVRFQDAALASAALWSERYLPERKLPDKAIDVMDRSAVLAKGRGGGGGTDKVFVETEDVAAALEESVGMSPGSVSEVEARSILDLEEALRARVRGQEAAVRLVAAAVARARVQLQELHRPIGSLLLYGPPGVGKTSLAAALAEVSLGSRSAMVRIDCASASSAEGAGAALVKGVRRRPHSVVLIDEADKAQPEFLGLLLEVLEEASLTLPGVEGVGRADFRHTVIILTSNDPAGPSSLPRALADRLDGWACMRSLTSETLREVFDGLVEDFQGRLQRSYPMAYIEPSDRWREEVLAKIGTFLAWHRHPTIVRARGFGTFMAAGRVRRLAAQLEARPVAGELAPLAGKVAIVTGASSGVGAALSRRLAERGCGVVVNFSKSADDAAKVAEGCAASGAQVLLCQADVATDAGCEKLVAETVKRFGRVDFLVNNAGTTKFVHHGDLEGLNSADFRRIYDLNAIGAFNMIRLCAPHMRKAGGGRVVNVSSVAGAYHTVGSSVAYLMSKAALNALTAVMAKVLGPEIVVNAVCPGFIEGRWLREGMGPDLYDYVKDRLETSIPMKAVATRTK
ncbi:clpC [Symbiodinium sp. KB8]|nr:clpC [Symbiodinium sp. KB8]